MDYFDGVQVTETRCHPEHLHPNKSEGVLGVRFPTDKLNAIGVPVLPDIGVQVPAFHPLRYDAKLITLAHLDSFDCQDVLVFDLFGDHYLFAKSLEDHMRCE